MKADLDNEFAGLWIADKAARILVYQDEHGASAASDYVDHFEHVRTRTQILRQVAEELGQLPGRTGAAVMDGAAAVEFADYRRFPFPSGPDIETQPVRDVADLRSVRRKPIAAGVINEYHHAA